MARYDKYDPVSGGFRVVADEDNLDDALFGVVQGVGVKANGRAEVGGVGTSGFRGVTIVDRTKRRAGDVLDVMTHGEIVGLELTPGADYYLDGAGLLTETPSNVYVGNTVEAWRLVVRFHNDSTTDAI